MLKQIHKKAIKKRELIKKTLVLSMSIIFLSLIKSQISYAGTTDFLPLNNTVNQLRVIPNQTQLADANQQKFQARLELPEDLRPKNAPTIKIENKDKPVNEADYANFLLQLIAGSLLYLAGPVAILLIAYGGLSYIISHGKQEQMDKAKKTITWAIIGLCVIIFSYIIIQTIIQFALKAG